MPRRARILLADDHSLILTGVRALIADDFDLVGQVADGRSLVEEALRQRPDLIILDVTMPLLNGIDAARQIGKVWPEAKFLFLTMHADAIYLRDAFEAGGKGYLLKSSAAEELHDAIRAVLGGKRYLGRTIPAGVTDAVTNPVRGTTTGRLTSRQREVLQLLAEGRANKEIAQILNVSIKTVEFHRGQMMQILGVHTVAELTQVAMRIGLIDKGASV